MTNQAVWDPTVIYVGTHIFLPKKVGQKWFSIKHSLRFYSGNKSFEAYSDGPTHLAIPREYITPEMWATDFAKFPKMYIGPSQFPQCYMNPIYPLRDYQTPAFNAMMEASGIINLACGRGKTVIAIHAITARKAPAMVVVPTLDLAYQWKERIVEHTDLDAPEVGWAQGHPDTWKKGAITIGILKSIAKAAKQKTFKLEDQAFYGTWVFDECHNLSTTEFQHAAGLGFGMRWGLSATPYRRDGNEGLFYAHLGGLLYSDMNQPNVASVTFIKTPMQLTDKDIKACTVAGELHLSKVCSLVTLDPTRRKIISDFVKQLVAKGRKVLVLLERKRDFEYYENEFLGCGIVHGDISGESRTAEMAKNPVFATRHIAKEGLDKKGLDTVVCTYPFTDKANFVQICGRAQRGNDPKVFFFVDNIPPEIGMMKKLRVLAVEEGMPHQTIALENLDVNGLV